MLELQVVRDLITERSTQGRLSMDGVFQCYTLEPPKLPEPVKPRAIPAGKYRLTLRQSQRFGRIMPHVENVPGFEGILIHWGNSAKDTDGCTLVGEDRGPQADWVGVSKTAFVNLFAKLQLADKAGEEMWITYSEVSVPDLTGEISV